MPVRRQGGQRGASLVEMIVASLVLGVGVLGVASVLVNTAKATDVAEVRAIAVDLATAELEQLRALDYESVGIATSAEGYVGAVDGLLTVTESTNLVEPLGQVVEDGITFDVERSVVWSAVGTDLEAFKVVEVVIRWESPAGTEELRMQTGLHPGLANG